MNPIELIVTVLTLSAIYGVVILALNYQYGHADMINFGVVAYFAAGAYVYVILTQEPPGQLDQYLFGFALPPWIGLLGAGAAGVVLALITGWPALRLRGEYLAVTTFAFAEVLHSFLVNERRIGNGNVGLVGLDRPYRELFEASQYRYVLLVASLVLCAITFVVLERIVRSPYGRALRAMGDNELALLTSGKSSRRYRLEVFLVSAFFTGIAGAFYVSYTTLATPLLFTAEVTFLVWIALVLAGPGSSLRALAGITFLIAFEELVRALPVESIRAAQIITDLRVALLGLLFIMFLRWRPLERIGSSRRQKTA